MGPAGGGGGGGEENGEGGVTDTGVKEERTNGIHSMESTIE